MKTQAALHKALDHACVLSTIVCQALHELEKHDPEAVKRIEKEAAAHRERHRASAGLSKLE